MFRGEHDTIPVPSIAPRLQPPPGTPAVFDRFHWWHAVLIFVAANALSALPAGPGGDDAFYNRLRKPPFAPPDWAFPAAWFVLNVTSLIALSLVADAAPAPGTGGGLARTAFLVSEAAGWVLFAAFTTLYFGLRSLTSGAADTVLGLLAAGTSLCAAAALAAGPAGVGWAPFWLILPRFCWLALASYVAVAVAWLNRAAG